ncbi:MULTISPECIES: lipase family protein [unclassified Sphingobium]|uniref:lipase family protein n=1 Tax=unclassified Sphingobium TaxID=2611147 RepID=UPI002224EC3D|nr:MULTISPECIES: lipase family protein [unclassified Sphingobium]MCW2395742.1 hypothetical protein [Sphingobium sp. B8D3B]MCW2419257.1 hypothetical protein [Sphingobium sp. B8D3C]
MPSDLAPPHAGKATRILYTSTDGRWESGLLPVSGALYLPKGKAPAGGWTLIVWSHGTLGVSDACAPSWVGANARDRAYVDRWLEKGYAVVAPDYQGLGGPGPHAYTIWKSEGQSVLDAARVAVRMDKRIANRIVITGQSQGSGASLGAARLARSYAPDLNVKGAIATALVTTFPDASGKVDAQEPGDSPHYIIYRMVGGSLPDGSPPPETYLTEKGKRMLEVARTRCDPRVVAAQEDITTENAFSRPTADLNALLGPVGASTPFRTAFPLMIGTGLADELIPAARQAKGVRTICKAGNVVLWKRYEGANHSDTLTRSFDDAEAFARIVTSGRAVASDCGTL